MLTTVSRNRNFCYTDTTLYGCTLKTLADQSLAADFSYDQAQETCRNLRKKHLYKRKNYFIHNFSNALGIYINKFKHEFDLNNDRRNNEKITYLQVK